MVDELTQESFQTGKAIVTVSVDLITAILDTSFFLHYNAISLLIQYNCIDISLISMHLSKIVGMESWITIKPYIERLYNKKETHTKNDMSLPKAY